MTHTCRNAIAIVVTLLASSASPNAAGDDVQFPNIRSGITLGKALVLSDSQIIDSANGACAFKDQTTRLAPEGSPHAERLARLTQSCWTSASPS
jgi:hypothetical protein